MAAHAANGGNTAGRHTQRRKIVQKHLIVYSFLIPIFVSAGLFKYYPFFIAIVESFYEWNGANVNRFVGLDNFIALFQDKQFWIALKNVSLLTAGFVAAQYTFPLWAAVVIFRLRHRVVRSLYRNLLLIPLVVPHIIIYLMWKWIYSPSGLLNRILSGLGLESLTHAWLGESKTALWSIFFVNFPWIGGVFFLIFLAGLLSIPTDLFEVGKIDGMNGWQRFAHLEFPMIRNQVKLVMILAFIQMFQSFENILVLTNGGPGFATVTPALYIYKQGFDYQSLGYASAIGSVMFVIIALFTILSNRYFKSAEQMD